METAATTERKAPARRRAPKAEHLSMAHPDLPGVEHPHFWLAAYLAKHAERVVIEHLEKKMSKPGKTTLHALWTAIGHLIQEERKTAEYLCRDGLLLYAWPGTKLFTNPEARH